MVSEGSPEGGREYVVGKICETGGFWAGNDVVIELWMMKLVNQRKVMRQACEEVSSPSLSSPSMSIIRAVSSAALQRSRRGWSPATTHFDGHLMSGAAAACIGLSWRRTRIFLGHFPDINGEFSSIFTEK